MFYDFDFTIPAGTAQTSPATKRMKLAHGIIHTVRVFFPPGPRGEVSFQVFEGGHQVYPTNQGGVFNADNVYISSEDYYELTRAPYELVAKGWSPSATYDHTVRIQFGLLESKIALATLRIASGMEKFFKALGVKV